MRCVRKGRGSTTGPSFPSLPALEVAFSLFNTLCSVTEGDDPSPQGPCRRFHRNPLNSQLPPSAAGALLSMEFTLERTWKVPEPDGAVAVPQRSRALRLTPASNSCSSAAALGLRLPGWGVHGIASCRDC